MSIRKIFGLVACAVPASFMALVFAGCHEDAACSVDDQSGCDEGLVCRTGSDGKAGCFCSTDEQTGCSQGLACYDVDDGDPACFCSVDRQTGCEDEALACEPIPGQGAGCFPPVTVSGTVFDLTTEAAVEGAHVVTQDANNAALSGVAVTDVDGNYSLQVPTPRTEDGGLLTNNVTLRADAPGYLTFPLPPRVAIPVNTGLATGDPLNLDTAATDVALIPLQDTTGLGIITGTVKADGARGTLVVAGGMAETGGGVTGIADFDGSYTVFNVPAGTVSVKGYKVDLQLTPATANVSAGETTENVDLEALDSETSTVEGKIEIVNPGDGRDTSVILVVDETFDPTFASGQTPPGLRIAPVDGDFSIQGVPDGNYAVLAAFENDLLVRDPDTSIAGTDIVHIQVANNMVIDQSFKVTGALDVISPDGEEVVSGAPTFVWADDSGEDHYEIVVYDAFGNLIWERTDIPGISGSAEASVAYEGPALEPGMLYQFRATSIKLSGSPLARTEDLRGVFVAG